MPQSLPKTTKQWNVVGRDGFKSLQLTEEPLSELGDSEVLVKLQGATLNFRDLMIPQDKYPWHVKPDVIPGSDGAGTVLAVGKHVTRFQPGDKVVTVIHRTHLSGSPTSETPKFGLGAGIDGTFRTVAAFNEQGLVPMPQGLSFIEAASLTCAGLTAWNALFGLPGKQLSVGQWLLTQGTGGVSIFAIQFAKAIGARVIATTSSDKKAELLKKLGADHIINYRTTKDWGSAAKELTGGVGVDLVVEVAGASTLKQSAASVRLDGTITTTGLAGGDGQGAEVPNLLDTWLNLYTARGVWVGNRHQMEEMCKVIESSPEKLRPVIDPKVFKLEDLREAYEYLESGKHQGKVGIEID
ncbi:putative alcohol dehydrogenase [Colletotrichum karsti]|uniref:Alcohol dehydrogenase n=1 Tax=Colletotrichum karsti TaxID=1095194 RepID=A0A9P6IA69_9PEZI|nr:putative alcohol dehydrogenase [Colletotrichum karsti]KAF9878021.1 putative alcohol dehydrogenase [Colletotrichum karsti]